MLFGSVALLACLSLVALVHQALGGNPQSILNLGKSWQSSKIAGELNPGWFAVQGTSRGYIYVSHLAFQQVPAECKESLIELSSRIRAFVMTLSGPEARQQRRLSLRDEGFHLVESVTGPGLNLEWSDVRRLP